MSGLTEEQWSLYTQLEEAIKNRQDIAGLFKGISKDNLLEVLVTRGTTIEFKNGEKEIEALHDYALIVKNQESLVAILNMIREKGISFKEVLCTRNITINSPNVIRFDGTPPKEKQAMKMFFSACKESGNLRKFFIEMFNGTKKSGESVFGFNEGKFKDIVAVIGKDGLEELKGALKETGHYDDLNQILQLETRMAADKALIIGSVCSVIAALAVSSGCFAVSAQLSTLAIVGIAVAAALVIEFAACSITYAISKPSDKLDGVSYTAHTSCICCSIDPVFNLKNK
ncbi:hypothetical protein GO684_02320 [Wolbachia endosymbiont of Litomosoides brasiliensis]|uniref:hypothetical protein n=1 Tax=Wolbachia endosymbiont of Litomosoides brasiliensis TaxID=1812117 RepID=UPI00158F3AC3|nr:hypothetical protein [Wolbachia endosymbiont of Litomosoides brasiliensis]NUY39519.1 hypothetical protein [Wolbachia endosymbiont of Litomosoides brasiliensis]